jgi:hypothetical protein
MKDRQDLAKSCFREVGDEIYAGLFEAVDEFCASAASIGQLFHSI